MVDAGGRGNAIAHAFARSKAVEKVFVAPGNAGSEMMEKCRLASLQGKPPKSIPEMLAFAKQEKHRSDLCGPGRLSIRWNCQYLPGRRAEDPGAEERGGGAGGQQVLRPKTCSRACMSPCLPARTSRMRARPRSMPASTALRIPARAWWSRRTAWRRERARSSAADLGRGPLHHRAHHGKSQALWGGRKQDRDRGAAGRAES